MSDRRPPKISKVLVKRLTTTYHGSVQCPPFCNPLCLSEPNDQLVRHQLGLWRYTNSRGVHVEPSPNWIGGEAVNLLVGDVDRDISVKASTWAKSNNWLLVSVSFDPSWNMLRESDELPSCAIVLRWTPNQPKFGMGSNLDCRCTAQCELDNRPVFGFDIVWRQQRYVVVFSV